MRKLANFGKYVLCLAVFSAALTGSRASAEVIGIWDVVSPVSASLVGGSTDEEFFFWLNVVDAPVTIEEAFTGYSILDDGYANFTGEHRGGARFLVGCRQEPSGSRPRVIRRSIRRQ
jgi:hypothetical protein